MTLFKHPLNGLKEHSQKDQTQANCTQTALGQVLDPPFDRWAEGADGGAYNARGQAQL